MDTRVKVDSTRHLFEMGISAGLRASQDKLESLPKNLQATPGFQLALATICAMAAEQRASTVSRNLALLARNGVDIATHKAISYDPNTDELICEFYAEQEVE